MKLITNGYVVCPLSGRKGKSDILIDNNRIIEINDKINCDIATGDIFDAKGLTVIPGLVDAHCHLRDPGQEYKEDIITGSLSAAAGGFTSVACMPNTLPPADNAAVIEYIVSKAKKYAKVNIFPIGAISKGLKGSELAETGLLKQAGAVAVSDDGRPVSDASLMMKALLYSSAFDMPVISHCEDLSLSEGGYMNEGTMSTILGLRGIPRTSEEIMIAREILLSDFTGVPVHIAHVSSALSVNMIRRAKERGTKVTCETCPHYFTLTDSACDGFNTNAKVNPPLKSIEDVEAIIEGLKDGTIDIIATDHAPHHKDEKDCEFALAANGMIGFETAFSLSYTYLVDKGHITIEQLIEKMSVNPSRLLKLDRGILKTGNNADITVVDTTGEYRVDVLKMRSKSKNTPFDGFMLKGKIIYTFVGGELSYNAK